MIKFLAWIIRPVIAEAIRQIHRERLEKARADGAEGTEVLLYAAFGDALVD
jgi:hypothetical protein